MGQNHHRARKLVAQALGATSTWVLRHAFRRRAENFPGKVGLLADPNLIADLRSRISEGVVVVVGTNGKTTVTNLLADALEASGKAVACNRTGANLDSGIASALLHTRTADWGVLESDELWLPKILPQLQPDFVVLLNLFRDQLDRAGEIDYVQQRIVEALASSPETTLVYNADDPFCQAIANRCGNAHVPFGLSEDLELVQNSVADSSLCQVCDATLVYSWRQYGQLGAYRCPQCGFVREEPVYQAADVRFSEQGVSFTLTFGEDVQKVGRVQSSLAGAYMAYNLLATCAAADCCRVPFERISRTIARFAPENGRLQAYRVGEHTALLNLAKNPVGLNQNLRIALSVPGSKAVALFINDKEADGRDVSWLWDADLGELAQARDLAVFAGGIRRNDLQVRLKYAGVSAQLVDGARDFMQTAHEIMPEADLFLIANYTALPDVKAALDEMARENRGRIHASQGESFESADKHSGEAERHPSRQHFPERAAAATNSARASAPTPSDSRKSHTTISDPAPSKPNKPTRSVYSLSKPVFSRPTSPNSVIPDLVFSSPQPSKPGLTIVHLYPDLLNLYGDGGNVAILANRLRWRGIETRIVRTLRGERIDLRSADIAFLGGGPDREQRIAAEALLEQADALRNYVEDDGVLLAICGGFQIIGREWLLGDETVPGLELADFVTKRAQGGSRNRIVGNIALDSPLANAPVIGYENHAGRTYLGTGCEPFGRVIGKSGKGNNDTDGIDGVRFRNVVGTYLHGPLLAKNPEIADRLIEQALARRAAKEGLPSPTLSPLDDTEEHTANAFMSHRLNAR